MSEKKGKPHSLRMRKLEEATIHDVAQELTPDELAHDFAEANRPAAAAAFAIDPAPAPDITEPPPEAGAQSGPVVIRRKAARHGRVQ